MRLQVAGCCSYILLASKSLRLKQGTGANKSPRLSRSGELFLSLTKQNYLKLIVFAKLIFDAVELIDCSGFEFAAWSSDFFMSLFS